MKVRALRFGYYNNARIKEGVEFEMKDSDYSPVDEDGDPVKTLKGKVYHPTWVEPVDEDEAEVKRPSKGGKSKPKPEQPVEDVI